MRTSASQFELLVNYMEHHGDLSKPASNARGRMVCLEKWEKLTEILNGDGSGDMKTTEKWKKVWSDYKNNTKRKVARLRNAAIETSDPAVLSKLTDLEQRVLNLTGIQIATGLEVQEAGIVQDTQQQDTATKQSIKQQIFDFIVQPTEFSVPSSPNASTDPLTEEVLSRQWWDEPEPQSKRHIPSPSTVEPHKATPSPPLRNTYAPSLAVEVLVENGTLSRTPRRHSSHNHIDSIEAEPARSGQTTPLRRTREKSTRIRGSHRRRVRPTVQDAQQSQAEKSWRIFIIEQHRDYMVMRREQNRIRELELQTYRDTQREWQRIGSRVLDIANMLVSKFGDN